MVFRRHSHEKERCAIAQHDIGQEVGHRGGRQKHVMYSRATRISEAMLQFHMSHLCIKLNLRLLA